LRVHDCKCASAVSYGDETYAYLTPGSVPPRRAGPLHVADAEPLPFLSCQLE
jgi:hypothetical protein